jgi:hypothetical protein
VVGSEFASCWLKLGRAHEHLDTLTSELSEWHRNDPYVVSSNSDANGSRYGFVIEIKIKPPLDRWSLIAGDCIHNLRSALDTALYALAVRENHGVDPANAGQLQFPICDTPDALAKQISQRRMTGLSTKAQVWIERAQPYVRSYVHKPPLIRLLAEFDNLNKHRMMNLILQHLYDAKIESRKISTADHSFKVHFVGTPIQSGAEVASVIIDPPNANLDLKFTGSISVTVSHSPSPSGESISSLHDVLAALITEARGIINDAI